MKRLSKQRSGSDWKRRGRGQACEHSEIVGEEAVVIAARGRAAAVRDLVQPIAVGPCLGRGCYRATVRAGY